MMRLGRVGNIAKGEPRGALPRLRGRGKQGALGAIFDSQDSSDSVLTALGARIHRWLRERLCGARGSDLARPTREQTSDHSCVGQAARPPGEWGWPRWFIMLTPMGGCRTRLKISQRFAPQQPAQPPTENGERRTVNGERRTANSEPS
jgi:hypothetical protein